MKKFSHRIINPIQALFGGFRRIGAAGCALALLAVVSTSALAQSSGQTRPSKLTEVETVTQNSDGSGNTWVGWGVATGMGKFTSSGANTYLGVVDGVLYGFGIVSFVAANGDMLFVKSEWALDLSTVMLLGRATITGGTGRFSHATGESDLVGHLNEDGTFTVISDGVANY
jgi:hypothetical protein